MNRRGSVGKWVLRLLSATLVAAAAYGLWAYFRIYSRPADLFDARVHGPAAIDGWNQELQERITQANNSLATQGGCRLRLTDRQVNAFLYRDAPVLFPDAPDEFDDYQIAFRPGVMVVRFRYQQPDVHEVYVSVEIGLDKSADGSFGLQLERVALGRQPIPRSMVASRAAELLPESDAIAGTLDLAELRHGDRLRRLLGGLLRGGRLGPNLTIRLPGGRKSVARTAVVRDFRIEQGELALDLDPADTR